jgi:hypothetical protein
MVTGMAQVPVVTLWGLFEGLPSASYTLETSKTTHRLVELKREG